MSTMIALFLVFAALVGCAGETSVNVKNAPPPPPAVAFSAETERYEETVRDEDGADLAVCSYDLPVLRVLTKDGVPVESAESEEQERALAIAETFNARFDQWKTNPKTLAEGAREDRTFRNESGLDPVAYTDDLSCAVYQTEHLISVAGVYYMYTGGAHPNSILMSWNFDLDTGEFFELETLDEGGDFRAFVQAELILQAREHAADEKMAPGDYYWEDYETTLADWPSYAVSFDAEGMTVGFSPYELAAYAAGPQVFRLSYDQLRPHLGPHGRMLLGLEAEAEGGEEAAG